MEHIERALKAASGNDIDYYPFSAVVEAEIPTLTSYLSQDRGTSLLIESPCPLLKLAFVKRALTQLVPSLLPKTIYINGTIYNEPHSLLKFMAKQLRAPTIWKTFDEMAASLTVYCQEFGQRYVIALSSFERFVSGPTPGASTNQHFLYTLFELTLNWPVFVLCLTERADTLDLLEKRVKSRFSQTVIYLPFPRTFDEYFQTIQAALKGTAQPNSRNNKERTFVRDVQQFLTEKQTMIRLQELFVESHDPRTALTLFIPSLIRLKNGQRGTITMELGLGSLSGRGETNIPLSLVELCVLVALRRTLAKQSGEIVTFDALYREYQLGFATSAKVTDGRILSEKFTRSVMRIATDSLLAKGWLTNHGSNGDRPVETIDTRQAIYCKVPLRKLPDLIGPQCPESLYKLLTEAL